MALKNPMTMIWGCQFHRGRSVIDRSNPPDSIVQSLRTRIHLTFWKSSASTRIVSAHSRYPRPRLFQALDQRVETSGAGRRQRQSEKRAHENIRHDGQSGGLASQSDLDRVITGGL